MADVLAQRGTDSTAKLCKVCHRNAAKYTCPGCSTRTCSVPCSTGHKTVMGCTGKRNKAAYVPMNKYGWGTMMDDYVFLEDIGRQVGEWGKEIIQGGFTIPRSKSIHASGHDTRFKGFQRDWGRGMGRNRGNSKRYMLKTQLEARNIEMDLLPVGMERQKLNQSYWNSKNRTAILTIEFKFHPPRDPFCPSSQRLDPPYVFLRQQNSTKTPLLTLARRIVEHALSKKGSTSPSWLKPLLLPDPDDPESFTAPHFVMPAQVDPRYVTIDNSKDKGAYYRFNPSKTLTELLRNTRFVEFPTIEVWDEFRGRVVDVGGAVTQRPIAEEPSRKRRKLATKAGLQAINGLLDGYGSSGDDDEETPRNGLAMLGGYVESDSEDIGALGKDGSEEDNEDALTDSDAEVEQDPSSLLELIRRLRDSGQWPEDKEHGLETSSDEEGYQHNSTTLFDVSP